MIALPMATGAGDRYWENQGLPSVLKHDLLRRYLPVFAAKTGSRSAGGVVYLDGYSGRGRYDDGTPALGRKRLPSTDKETVNSWSAMCLGRAEK